MGQNLIKSYKLTQSEKKEGLCQNVQLILEDENENIKVIKINQPLQMDCELIKIEHVRFGQLYIDDQYISFISQNKQRPDDIFYQYGKELKTYYKG